MKIDSAQKLITGIETYIGRYAPRDGVSPEIYQSLLNELQILRMRYSRYKFDGNLIGNSTETEAHAATNLVIEALAIIHSRLFLPLTMLRYIAKSEVLQSQLKSGKASSHFLEEGDPPTAMLQMIPVELLQIEADFKEIVLHLLEEIETVYDDTETAHAIGNYFNSGVG